MNRRLLISVATIASIISGAVADHIPGHDNDSNVHPMPLPGQEFFTGGILFVTAIGPIGGREILSTDFDITWVSDGATPASNLEIFVSMFIDDGFGNITQNEIHVTGADLGFGSGPGTFTGLFSTDAFNGLAVESFLFPPNSIVNLTIGATTGGIDGTSYFENSFINYNLAPIPTPASTALLAIAGVTATRRRR